MLPFPLERLTIPYHTISLFGWIMVTTPIALLAYGASWFPLYYGLVSDQ